MRKLDGEHIGGELLLLLGDTLTVLLLTAGGAFAWVSVYVLPSHPLFDLGALAACCILLAREEPKNCRSPGNDTSSASSSRSRPSSCI